MFSGKWIRKIIVSLAVVLAAPVGLATATHLRGGYITLRSTSTSSLTYEIEVVVFGDTGSTVSVGGGEIDFGDGTVEKIEEAGFSVEKTTLGNEVAVTSLRINHTFPAAGMYTVSVREFYRNVGVVNMANSVETPFVASTTIVVDPFFGANTTPSLALHPVIFSKAGSKFFTSVNFIDVEGDSLVYSLAVPKSSIDNDVFEYSWPNAEKFYQGEQRDNQPAFSLDKLSGQLIWDTPLMPGEFAIAYRVLEYRKVNGTVYKLSDTTIDLQIVNQPGDTAPPEIDFDYTADGDGRIDFTANYRSEANDTLVWSFYTSQSPLVLNGNEIHQKQLLDTIADGTTLVGNVMANPATDRPVLFVVSARSLHPSNPFSTVKSFAVNPTGKEYALTSAKDAGLEAKMELFPNPASQNINIRLSGDVSDTRAQLQLLNAAGQSISFATLPIRGNLATLNLEGLPKGVYLLRMYLEGQVYYSKFVKD